MDERFASELLREIKANAKRWFIAFCVMVGVEIATVFGFLWYISLPVEETTTTYTQESDDGAYNQIIGGDYNGSEADNENDLQKTGNTQ